MNNNDDNHSIVSIGQIDIDATSFNAEPNLNDLPILPTRNLVLFPGVTIPISLVRENSRKTAEYASKHQIPIGIVCQINADDERPAVTTGLFKYGVFADVLKVFNLPDGNYTAIVRARGKFKIMGKGDGLVIPNAELSAKVKPIKDTNPRSNDKEFLALSASIKESTLNILKKTSEGPNELVFNIANFPDPVGLINLISSHLPFDVEFRQSLLAQNRLKERAFALLSELSRNEQMVDISRDIQKRARKSLDEQQRNVFLHQQMETIRQELYGDSDDADNLRARADKIQFPEHVAKAFDKELEKLRRLNPQSPDYSIQFTYLETLIELPWNNESPLNTDFKRQKRFSIMTTMGLIRLKIVYLSN